MEETINMTQGAATETVTTGAVAAADQPDAFLASFDNADTLGGADQPVGEAGETKAQGADDTGADQPPQDTPQGAPSDGVDKAATETGADKADTPTSWDIKHMDRRETISADDPRVPELLQKGSDYDRVREQRDAARQQLAEAAPALALVKDLAGKAGLSVEAFARQLRVEAKKSEGMTPEEAARAVTLDEREAAVAAAEQRRAEAAREGEQRSARIRADIDDFKRAFPDVYAKSKGDPKGAIPESVWRDVDAGMPLVAAYSKYAVETANAALAAEKARTATATQNATNAARTTGSMRSAGSDAHNKDDFLAAFGG